MKRRLAIVRTRILMTPISAVQRVRFQAADGIAAREDRQRVPIVALRSFPRSPARAVAEREARGIFGAP
jgi:hypothetical protein